MGISVPISSDRYPAGLIHIARGILGESLLVGPLRRMDGLIMLGGNEVEVHPQRCRHPTAVGVSRWSSRARQVGSSILLSS